MLVLGSILQKIREHCERDKVSEAGTDSFEFK
jgi:hypothetical protein